MEEIAERIANFDLSNPILVEFFKQVLHDPIILRKDDALSCLLTIAEKLCLPWLISQESYKEALQEREKMGIELYVREVNFLIEEIGQKEALWPVSLIALTMFSNEEEKKRVQEHFGVLLYMIRLERQKEETIKKRPY